MSQSGISRRQFLGMVGVTLGACACSCVGLSVFPAGEVEPDEPPPIGFPDISLGGDATDKILVAYASAAGSTGGIAELIGRTLAADGASVDVRPVQTVDNLDPYRAVVLGSAIHGGKWLPEAISFLQANQDALRRLPTALFLVCLMVGSESNQKNVDQFIAEERALVKPVAEGQFLGRFSTKSMSVFEKLPMRFFLAYCGLGFRGGDFRQPDAIRAWSASVRPLLTG